ncbi:hypothetical protein B566_EDAN013063 [Ephemera danica]|nr:hypothetical protein B566_EDAN013063 [Ephemera danica]
MKYQISRHIHAARAAAQKISSKFYKVSIIDDTWQADLCDMHNLASENDNMEYILTVIDARPLKDKSAQTVKRAFESIIAESKRSPRHLMTDRGKEFEHGVMKAI